MTKRQKVSPTPLSSQASQSSFADVLARIQIDSQGSQGAFTRPGYAPTLINKHGTRPESEGGADSWARPLLKPIVGSRDSIGTESFNRTGPYRRLIR